MIFNILTYIFLFLVKAESFAPTPIPTRLNHKSSLLSNERYMSNDEGNDDKPHIENVLLVECGEFTQQKKISLEIIEKFNCNIFITA